MTRKSWLGFGRAWYVVERNIGANPLHLIHRVERKQGRLSLLEFDLMRARSRLGQVVRQKDRLLNLGIPASRIRRRQCLNIRLLEHQFFPTGLLIPCRPPAVFFQPCRCDFPLASSATWVGKGAANPYWSRRLVQTPVLGRSGEPADGLTRSKPNILVRGCWYRITRQLNQPPGTGFGLMPACKKVPSRD